MEYVQLLESLGYHKNEIDVYLALLRVGPTQAGTIVKATKRHRMIVYNALEKLTDAGLATVTRHTKVQIFQAADPIVLLEQTKRTHERMQIAVPLLRKLRQHTDAVSVRTLVGSDGFKTNLQEVVESAVRHPSKEICIIGGAKDTDFYNAVGDWYETYEKLVKKNRVHKRLLAPASYHVKFKERFQKEFLSELRLLPQNSSSPIYTRITHDMVTMELYEPSLTVIQIRSAAIARSYLDSFTLLWNNAKQ